jgi:DNA invertase Pin-like site-specific DNA recombinase
VEAGNAIDDTAGDRSDVVDGYERLRARALGGEADGWRLGLGVLQQRGVAALQYALRQKAIALGWQAERIVTIDTDQGQSGASAADREGFQRLVAEVSMGRAGIVLGLEVSRLARNNADWHRLLEICAMSATLICDEDGLYDPTDFNDRLLLGLKGTMSEAELHFVRARLVGGQLSKARRGELQMGLPVGLVYDPTGKVVLDPDTGVQQAIRHVFTLFTRTGSARATVQQFNADGLLFPVRVRTGARKGELAWMPLQHWRVLRTLDNPRYAGAFAYGRRRERLNSNGKKTLETLPREQWIALIPDAHPGYISWNQYEINQKLLLGNATAYGEDRAAGPAREGTALLQGLAICGRCGRRMTVRYHTRRGVEVPDYQCMNRCIQDGGQRCQSVPGGTVDTAVGTLLLDTLTPHALEIALTVQAELDTRAAEADALRRQAVERARRRADLARRRYLGVDPDNRLVADSLEADWNDALRALQTHSLAVAIPAKAWQLRQTHPDTLARRSRPAPRHPHRRPGRRGPQHHWSPLRRGQTVHRPHRARGTPQQQPAQPRRSIVPGRRRRARISGGWRISRICGRCTGSATPRSAWTCSPAASWAGG